MSIQFDLPKDRSSIIKVIGVGGGGGNAVNHMFRQGIVGVNFVVCNTDQQALDLSPVPNKIQLGATISEGRGAGMNPEVGKRSALEALDQITDVLTDNTKMVFVTAGMGKGTGTGGAPVIAKAARELGILTVGLVTTPFSAEGPKRFQQAQDGINELRNYVDTILVISNDKLREVYGNLKLSQAFSHADDILANAARSIAEIITVAGYVNVDFEDVNTVMRDSGVAIMGTAISEGENRAITAIEKALNSPLLNDNQIKGAKNILVNVTSGKEEVTLDEVSDITEYIQREAGYDTNIIWGNCTNESLGEKLSVTIIATGFEISSNILKNYDEVKKIKLDLSKPEVTLEVTNAVTEDFVAEVSSEPIIKEIYLPPVTPAAGATPRAEKLIHAKEELHFEQGVINTECNNTEEETVESNTEIKVITRENSGGNKEDSKMNLSTQAKLERNEKLRRMSYKTQNQNILNEMERQPAFVRRGQTLKDVPHSSDSNLSSYYLSEEEEGKLPELKKNNSFLHGHDKVD